MGLSINDDFQPPIDLPCPTIFTLYWPTLKWYVINGGSLYVFDGFELIMLRSTISQPFFIAYIEIVYFSPIVFLLQLVSLDIALEYFKMLRENSGW